MLLTSFAATAHDWAACAARAIRLEEAGKEGDSISVYTGHLVEAEGALVLDVAMQQHTNTLR